ncbi:MAG: L,D-transpeptidase family protein [Acidobacteriota bacterium]|nr:L,D-transpeptidase family protein [Acidobacteriota bacterium]
MAGWAFIMDASALTRRTRQTLAAGCLLGLLLFADGCRKPPRRSHSAENTTEYASQLQAIVTAHRLPGMRWPSFGEYGGPVAAFYEARDYEVAWTRDAQPTPQAIALQQAFFHADARGLMPQDYDAALWTDRNARLKDATGHPDPEAIAQFDVAMTLCAMRYASNLHMGRVNPSHFNFDIDVSSKKIDLVDFVGEHLVDSPEVAALLATLEPDSEEYRKTEAALQRYLGLARQQAASPVLRAPLPVPEKAIAVGEPYAAATALAARLQLEGDLPADTPANLAAAYDDQLAAAVTRYQHRHGLPEDGKLSPATVRSLNVPLTMRVLQLADALERWRWLPSEYLHPRLLVNLPEFQLHTYNAQGQPEFSMRVVAGQVKGDHETPVLARMMRYVVFRPYWNVPVSIVKKELAPHIAASGIGYLASKNFEVTDRKGNVLPSFTASQVVRAQVMVRERPGPTNSLGLVKFMFPNQFSVYMHSTPEMRLFARTRRDYSHGCVRLEKAEDLAVWILQQQNDRDGQPWDQDKVHDAMNSGPDNHTVALKTPLPVVLFYLTGFVESDGEVHFFDDIYGYDAALNRVLSKGPPYPTRPEPVVSKTKDEDTV